MNRQSFANHRLVLMPALILLVSLTLSQAALAGDAETARGEKGKAPALSPEQKAHLVAAQAKWGVIKVIFAGLAEAQFKGSNASRAALSSRARQVSTIAAPALNKWVIRPESKYLGGEVATALDRIHSRLEEVDLVVEFCNSPDRTVWQKGAAKIDEQIKTGAAEITALFRKLPRPRMALPADFPREVIRDEIRIVCAFLSNQDKDHRWTLGATKDAPCDPAEVARVAMLPAQVLDISADMIECVLCNRQDLNAEAVAKLTEAHAVLTNDRDVSLRVIHGGSYDWNQMHRAFHLTIDKAWRWVDSAWGSLL